MLDLKATARVASAGIKFTHPGVGAETLVNNWGVSGEIAHRMLGVPTWVGTLTEQYPTPSRGYRTKDHQFVASDMAYR